MVMSCATVDRAVASTTMPSRCAREQVWPFGVGGDFCGRGVQQPPEKGREQGHASQGKRAIHDEARDDEIEAKLPLVADHGFVARTKRLGGGHPAIDHEKLGQRISEQENEGWDQADSRPEPATSAVPNLAPSQAGTMKQAAGTATITIRTSVAARSRNRSLTRIPVPLGRAAPLLADVHQSRTTKKRKRTPTTSPTELAAKTASQAGTPPWVASMRSSATRKDVRLAATSVPNCADRSEAQQAGRLATLPPRARRPSTRSCRRPPRRGNHRRALARQRERLEGWWQRRKSPT